MAENAVNLFSFSQIESAQSVFMSLFRLQEQRRECVIPAIVESYSSTRHCIVVRPLVSKVMIYQDDSDEGSSSQTKDEERDAKKMQLSRTLLKLKVQQNRHGNFVIDYPYQKGDTGFIIASDRNWVEALKKNSFKKVNKNEGEQEPGSFELASFVNGAFYPFAFADDASDEMEITSELRQKDERILEQPTPSDIVALQMLDKKEQMILSYENQCDSDSTSSDSDSTIGAAIIIQKDGNRIRLRGGNSKRPESIWVDDDATTITDCAEIKGLPPDSSDEDMDSQAGDKGKHEDYTTVDGRTTFVKKATIDPVKHLGPTDAKFRKVYYVSAQSDSGSDYCEGFWAEEKDADEWSRDAHKHLWLMSARILSDIPVKIRKINADWMSDFSGWGSGGGGGGGGCSCSDFDFSIASDSDSVVVDFLYDSQGNSAEGIEPYTIVVKRGKVTLSKRKTDTGRAFTLATSEEEHKRVIIPTQPISEVVFPWALIPEAGNLEESDSDSSEIAITSFLMQGTSGTIYRITLDDSGGKPTFDINPK